MSFSNGHPSEPTGLERNRAVIFSAAAFTGAWPPSLVAKWHVGGGDPTLADVIVEGLLHHSHVLNIKAHSYRYRVLGPAVGVRQ